MLGLPGESSRHPSLPSVVRPDVRGVEVQLHLAEIGVQQHVGVAQHAVLHGHHAATGGGHLVRDGLGGIREDEGPAPDGALLVEQADGFLHRAGEARHLLRGLADGEPVKVEALGEVLVHGAHHALLVHGRDAAADDARRGHRDVAQALFWGVEGHHGVGRPAIHAEEVEVAAMKELIAAGALGAGHRRGAAVQRRQGDGAPGHPTVHGHRGQHGLRQGVGRRHLRLRQARPVGHAGDGGPKPGAVLALDPGQHAPRQPLQDEGRGGPSPGQLQEQAHVAVEQGQRPLGDHLPEQAAVLEGPIVGATGEVEDVHTAVPAVAGPVHLHRALGAVDDAGDAL